MRKKITYLCALLCALSLAGCAAPAAGGQAPELLEPVSVVPDTVAVTRGDVFKAEVYRGEVVPYFEGVTFAMDGKLEAVYVQLGQTVTKGQLLASLDCGQINKQVAELNAQISDIRALGQYADRQIQADIDIAKEEMAMLEESGASAEALQVQQADIDILEARLKQNAQDRNAEISGLNTRIAELQSSLEKSKLYAPFDGVVAYTETVGTKYWLTGSQPVMYLADESQLYVRCEQMGAFAIKNADRIYAKVGDGEYDLTYLPYDSREYLAMLKANVTITSRFSVAKADALEAGEFAAVVVVTDMRENVLYLPANALFRDGGGWYVYKIVDGQRVRCDISVGLLNDAKGEILSGLQEGDVVYVKN